MEAIAKDTKALHFETTPAFSGNEMDNSSFFLTKRSKQAEKQRHTGRQRAIPLLHFPDARVRC